MHVVKVERHRRFGTEHSQVYLHLIPTRLNLSFHSVVRTLNDYAFFRRNITIVAAYKWSLSLLLKLVVNMLVLIKQVVLIPILFLCDIIYLPTRYKNENIDISVEATIRSRFWFVFEF